MLLIALLEGKFGKVQGHLKSILSGKVLIFVNWFC